MSEGSASWYIWYGFKIVLKLVRQKSTHLVSDSQGDSRVVRPVEWLFLSEFGEILESCSSCFYKMGV